MTLLRRETGNKMLLDFHGMKEPKSLRR